MLMLLLSSLTFYIKDEVVVVVYSSYRGVASPN